MPLVDGIWQYEESDRIAPTFSEYMNLLADSTRAAIAEANADPGWTPISAPAGVTASFRKVGPLAQVRWLSTVSMASNGASVPLFTLPAAAPKPSQPVPADVTNQGLYPMTARLTNAGQLQIRNNHNAAIATHEGLCTFLVEL